MRTHAQREVTPDSATKWPVLPVFRQATPGGPRGGLVHVAHAPDDALNDRMDSLGFQMLFSLLTLNSLDMGLE